MKNQKIKKRLKESWGTAFKLDGYDNRLKEKIESVLFCLPANVEVINVLGVEGNIWSFDLKTNIKLTELAKYQNESLGFQSYPYMDLGSINPKQGLREQSIKTAYEAYESFVDCLCEKYTVVNGIMAGVKNLPDQKTGEVEFQVIITFLTKEIMTEKVNKLINKLLKD